MLGRLAFVITNTDVQRPKPTPRSRRLRSPLVALATIGAAAILAACGSGSSGTSAATSTPARTTAVKFDPAIFDNPATGRNPYYPLIPGTQSVREGSTLVGGRAVPHQVTTTVTNAYRTVDGVKTVLSLDREVDAGQVTQVSLDFLAEDKQGNVWNLGGYTEQYEGGRFVSAIDPWLAGVNGAKAGILVQADPKTSTPSYSVDQPDVEEPSVAKVLKVGVRHCVPFNCFNDVLVVREGKASAPDNELKYYARDVGQIDNVPKSDSAHKDVEKMINLTKLSPKTLTEVSKDALKLDHNAPKQEPQIFGGKPLGKIG